MRRGVAVRFPALAVLTLGLAALSRTSAETEADRDQDQCGGCFFRRTPPRGPSVSGLQQHCSTLPGPHLQASLYDPTCQTTIYTACSVSGQQGARSLQEDSTAEDLESSEKRLLPSSLFAREHNNTSSPSVSEWSALVSGLIGEQAIPLCSEEGGVLYVLTGIARLEECVAGLLWSAACCAVSSEDGGVTGFGVGVVEERDRDGDPRAVELKELELLVGLTEIFLGGCGEEASQAGTEMMARFREVLNAVQKPDSNAHLTNTRALNHEIAQDTETAEDGKADLTQTQPEDSTGDGVTEEVMSQQQGHALSGEAPVLSEEAALDGDAESVSWVRRIFSAIFYLLSTSLWLLSTPLHLLLSTLAQLPGRVISELQQHLVLLAGLPVDIFSLFQNLLCDMVWGVSCALGVVTGVLGAGVSTLYSGCSPLAETLLTSCQTGVAGVGTLAGDGVDILGGVAGGVWGVVGMVGGTIWELGAGFIGTVLAEFGQQAWVIGEGFGKLVWRGSKGAGHIVQLVGGAICGVFGNTVENIMEAFGGE